LFLDEFLSYMAVLRKLHAGIYIIEQKLLANEKVMEGGPT